MLVFADLIEDVKKLKYEELEELRLVTDKYIADLDRKNILQSHLDAIEEHKADNLHFSSDINELKQMLDNV
jgi:hypothetical protein